MSRLLQRRTLMLLLGAWVALIGAGFTLIPTTPGQWIPAEARAIIWIAAGLLAMSTAWTLTWSEATLGLAALLITERVVSLTWAWLTVDAGWFSILYYLPVAWTILLAAKLPAHPVDPTREAPA